MWAARRSPGGALVGAFVRRISSGCYGGIGVGSSTRYAEAKNVAVEDTNEEEQKAEKKPGMFTVLRKARENGIDPGEALKEYNAELNLGVISLAMRTLASDPSRVMAVYSWAKVREGFVYTQELVVRLMSSLRKSDMLDQMQEILSDMVGKADPEVEASARSMLYMAYVRAKDTENAERVKNEMEERGLSLHPRALTRLLDLTFEAEGLDAMLVTFKDYRDKGVLPDRHGFSLLISRLCSGKKLDDALQMFKEYGEQEHTENTSMLLISELLKNDEVEKAEQIAQKGLFKVDSIKSDSNPVRLLIKKLGRQKSFEAAMKLMKVIVGQKHRSVCVGLMKEMIKEEEWDKAMELVDLLNEQGVKDDDASRESTTFISKLLEQNRIEDARKAFNVMAYLGLLPTSEVYSALTAASEEAEED